MSEATETSSTGISAERLRELIDVGDPFTLVDTRDDGLGVPYHLGERVAERDVEDDEAIELELGSNRRAAE